jgi:hypothetical protein
MESSALLTECRGFQMARRVLQKDVAWQTECRALPRFGGSRCADGLVISN